MMRPILVILTAYLLGSIPFGYLIVRARRGADVRESGSGGTGATNVTRSAGKVAGLITLLFDAAKGTAAVLIAKGAFGVNEFASLPAVETSSFLSPPHWWVALAAAAVILGHCFPVWLGFRGGKGVATGVGVFLCLAPLALGFAGILFVLVVWATRYVSLGSIIAAAAVPAFVGFQHMFVKPMAGFQYVLLVAIASAALIVFSHRANIARLMQGTERTIDDGRARTIDDGRARTTDDGR